MEFVKTHFLSLLCGLLVLIALIVPFWPMSGKVHELQASLTDRVSVYKGLNDLRTKPRTLPALNPDEANPAPLEGFPTQTIIDKGDQIRKTYGDQAKELMNEAVQINRHLPLVPRALPTPASSSDAFAFRDNYKEYLRFPDGGFCRTLKVGIPPTPDEIKIAQDTLFRTRYGPQLGTNLPGAGAALEASKQALMNEYNMEAAKVPENERIRVANSSMLYLNPDSLPFDQTFLGGAAPQPTAIWFAQVDLWCVQDIASAIIECDNDAKATNVTNAPVKHLVKIVVPRPSPYILMAGQTLDGELTSAAPKVYDLGQSQQNGPNAPSMMTGRVSNPLYDVIQFDVVVNVEAASATKFMETLSRNRFITVVQASVAAKDSGSLRQAGYIYGDKPVVELTLKCESIFFHSWERPLMPPDVVKLLAGQPAEQQMGAGGGHIDF